MFRAPGRVSECYRLFVAPCQNLPHQSTQFDWTGTALFVYVGYHSALVWGYHDRLTLWHHLQFQDVDMSNMTNNRLWNFDRSECPNLLWMCVRMLCSLGCNHSTCMTSLVQGREESRGIVKFQCLLSCHWKGLIWILPSLTVFSVDARSSMTDIRILVFIILFRDNKANVSCIFAHPFSH